MDDNEIFGFLGDQAHKEQVKTKVLQITTLIPSLYTLGQNAKFLEPGARILKRLCEDGKQSLRVGLQRAFKESNEPSGYFLVQDTETSLRRYEGNTFHQINYGIFQLWLFAGRHFP